VVGGTGVREAVDEILVGTHGVAAAAGDFAGHRHGVVHRDVRQLGHQAQCRTSAGGQHAASEDKFFHHVVAHLTRASPHSPALTSELHQETPQ